MTQYVIKKDGKYLSVQYVELNNNINIIIGFNDESLNPITTATYDTLIDAEAASLQYGGTVECIFDCDIIIQ